MIWDRSTAPTPHATARSLQGRNRRRFKPVNVARTIPLLLATAITLALDSGSSPHAGHRAGAGGAQEVRTAWAQSTDFLVTFDGRPASPQPWTPTDWDVTVNSRNQDTWDILEPMHADHGADCSAPPAAHITNSYEGAVYLCNDHVMTAINGGGYGMIYLTPNRLVDFSQGESTVRFDMSTFRTSGRDWVELWVTPFEENLQLAHSDDTPRRAVRIRMLAGLEGLFQAQIVRDHTLIHVTGSGVKDWIGYESFLQPSAVRRDTFELTLSRTRIRFGMPAHRFWWVDTPIADLGWDRGVVQFGQHSYDPTKGSGCAGSCRPNTWHWDNVSMQPSVPFTLLRADRRFVDQVTTSAVTFPAPAPSGAFLRFLAVGARIEVSADDGLTWQAAMRQAPAQRSDEHFSPYWTPIAQGTTEVRIRGVDWWGGRWRAKDISIWSLSAPDAAVSGRESTPSSSTPEE